MTRPQLGVCYYPEHWPQEWWAEDARRMSELGLKFVRIGEFAWSRLEPKQGQYEFAWLKQAIDTLHSHGLKVVLGTPTATPPKWLVDAMPDMLPVDAVGRPRGFGSRRHYDFSHEGYRDACRRIVTALAREFGEHPGVAAWQTDNEYECHNTTLSYSNAARHAFRDWLARRYQSPQALNRAWGNVFWSMEYNSFEEVELPNLAVTELNPAHRMDFRRFSSDQVASFNRLQVEILRKFSPGRDVIHNFMGRTLAFDHYDVGADLDVSSWDSYPLGFLDDRSDRPDDFRLKFLRAGDPDFQAFHHDLYRSTSNGRWWIMEQQPGPVNWAPHNPVPRDGMVRLWTWEAFAHGAEVVSYFRWRQAPFAQEQMHAGLLRPDSVEAPGFHEAKAVAGEIAALGAIETARSEVALILDYPSAWAWEIQPQGREFDYFRLVFDFYTTLRGLGLSVDIRSSRDADFSGHALIVVPGLFAWPEGLAKALQTSGAQVLIGPRSGSKTQDFAIPQDLPPGFPRDMLDAKVTRVESLPHNAPVSIEGMAGDIRFWREFVETGPQCETLLRAGDGHALLLRQGSIHYLAGWPDPQAMVPIVGALVENAGIAIMHLPEGLRLRRAGDLLFGFNYGPEPVDIAPFVGQGDYLLGQAILPPSGVACLRKPV
jgi:beta-galactosidase